jgi:hypothetical protein
MTASASGTSSLAERTSQAHHSSRLSRQRTDQETCPTSDHKIDAEADFAIFALFSILAFIENCKIPIPFGLGD